MLRRGLGLSIDNAFGTALRYLLGEEDGRGSYSKRIAADVGAIMKLSNISIRNLKSIREGGFNPTTFACLVGENNAGRSTVLQAVTYALNRPSQLPDQLYYDAQLPILVELV